MHPGAAAGLEVGGGDGDVPEADPVADPRRLPPRGLEQFRLVARADHHGDVRLRIHARDAPAGLDCLPAARRGRS